MTQINIFSKWGCFSKYMNYQMIKRNRTKCVFIYVNWNWIWYMRTGIAARTCNKHSIYVVFRWDNENIINKSDLNAIELLVNHWIRLNRVLNTLKTHKCSSSKRNNTFYEYMIERQNTKILLWDDLLKTSFVFYSLKAILE